MGPALTLILTSVALVATCPGCQERPHAPAARTAGPATAKSQQAEAKSQTEPKAPAKPDLSLDDDQAQALAALGYVNWAEEESSQELRRAGVTLHQADRVQPGLNLYKSLPSNEAHLLDLKGAVVHTWRAPKPLGSAWHHVELNEQGELFVVASGPLLKLDWQGRVLFEAPIRAHHDLDWDADGTLYVLTESLAPVGPEGTQIIDNQITLLDAEGRVQRQLSFAKLFADDLPPRRLAQIAGFLAARGEQLAQQPDGLMMSGTPLDVFHANSIEVLDRAVPGLGERGDVLVSIRSMSLVAVVDLAREKVVFRWGPGIVDHQHHATVLADGTVSIFDNGWNRTHSRVLRLDPRTREVVWQYPKAPDTGFYSKRRGSVQHLPNGNVLIAESERGHAFEVDPEGRRVWEFWNPERDPGKSARAQIYRMRRVPLEVLAGHDESTSENYP